MLKKVWISGKFSLPIIEVLVDHIDLKQSKMYIILIYCVDLSIFGLCVLKTYHIETHVNAHCMLEHISF